VSVIPFRDEDEAIASQRSTYRLAARSHARHGQGAALASASDRRRVINNGITSSTPLRGLKESGLGARVGASDGSTRRFSKIT